jgi:hypothetical protein
MLVLQLLLGLTCYWHSAFADCSALIRGQIADSPTEVKLDRFFFPYQIKSEAGLRPKADSVEGQILIGKKIKKAESEFNSFFQSAFQEFEETLFPAEAIPSLNPSKFEFWSNLKLERTNDLNSIIQYSKVLEGLVHSPINRFIYVFLPNYPFSNGDFTVKLAPLTLQGETDLGYAKHIALAEGQPVLAAGELAIKSGKSSRKLAFDLKSGTYMKRVSPAVQYHICQAVEDYLHSWLAPTWQVDFNEDSVRAIWGVNLN